MECEAVDPRASVAVDVVAEGSCCNRPRIRKLQDSSGNYVKNHLSPKKAFLNVFRTLKRKLVDLQTKNGQMPDFALIVKNICNQKMLRRQSPPLYR